MRAKVSSWRRISPDALIPHAKASGQYLNSVLAKVESMKAGYDEAILLDVHGYVSEGSGQNLFVVLKGELFTPALASSILAGITRDTVMTLARELGYTVREEILPREQLYAADELFYCGTAVEVTPITSVDRIVVGNGARGPVTKAIQDAFFEIVRGEVPDRHGWLTPVTRGAAARPAAPAPAGRT